jgi:hypothetical protein
MVCLHVPFPSTGDRLQTHTESCESFFATLEGELVDWVNLEDPRALRNRRTNNSRPHTPCGYPADHGA